MIDKFILVVKTMKICMNLVYCVVGEIGKNLNSVVEKRDEVD